MSTDTPEPRTPDSRTRDSRSPEPRPQELSARELRARERRIPEPRPHGKERFLQVLFEVTLWIKGADGVLELIGGILLLFLTPARMDAIVRFFTQHELYEDPNDPVANAIVQFSHHVTGSATLFGAVYLLLHGVVKVVLVWAVLREQLWAYPWMIGFLAVFVGWQCWELLRHFSWGLVALTAFDILIIALTVHEYRVQRRLHAERRAEAEEEPDGAAETAG